MKKLLFVVCAIVAINQDIALATQPLNLTVNDVVILALENNRELKSAYLQRIIDRQNLAIAEAKFNPIFAPEISLNYQLNNNEFNTVNRGEIGLGSTINLKIPTGADLSLNWQASSQTLDNNLLSQNISINLTQPLLKNAGREINLISIKNAQLTEKQNILNLINQVNSTITNAILAYINLFRNQEQVKIQELSLNRAKRQLEITEALIEAGRRARVDLVENQTAVANREVDVLRAKNNLDAARLALISILDLDKNLAITATEIPIINNLSNNFELNNLIELALSNNPNLLMANINLEKGYLDILSARNERKWDLNLDINYNLNINNNDQNNNDFRTALTFRRELGNLSLEKRESQSQINLQILENNLSEKKDNLDIEIRNNLRDINNTWQNVNQAKTARELSELQLENEREKLRLGVPGTRQIDLLNLEDNLVEAQNRELNANIDYYTSLIRLDQTIGNTWQKWGVKINN